MPREAPPTFQEWTQVTLSPELSLIPRAVDKLRNDLHSHGAPDHITDGVRLGVTEALANAIVHGKCPPGSPDVMLRWHWPDDWLCVEVSEPGEFVPPRDWTDLPADPLTESGRGGNLIRRQFDEIFHVNAGGRHTLQMRRRLGPPSPPESLAAELEQTLTAMTEDLSASYETVSALFRLAEALAVGEDLDAFVNRALALRGLTEADAIQIRMRDSAGKLALRGSAGIELGSVAMLDTAGDALEAVVFRSGIERTIDDRTPLAPNDPLRGMVGAGFVSPIHFQSRPIGVCVLVRRRPGAYFTAGQVSLARTTCEFLGIACANAEFQAERFAQFRAQRELEIAAQIQQSLLPATFPRRTDWRVHGTGLNAYEAGGDFFDVLEVDGGVLLVIADVMGKGMAAALLAVVLRTAVRGHATHAAAPGELLNRIQVQIAPDLERLGVFITAQAVFLHAGRPAFAYASAGHCPIVVLGPSANRRLEEGGLPLGVSQAEHYATHSAELARGERAFLTTDGVLETTDAAGKELGLDGFATLARQGLSREVAAACAELLAAVHRLDAGRAALDDRTLLAIERV